MSVARISEICVDEYFADGWLDLQDVATEVRKRAHGANTCTARVGDGRLAVDIWTILSYGWINVRLIG